MSGERGSVEIVKLPDRSGGSSSEIAATLTGAGG